MPQFRGNRSTRSGRPAAQADVDVFDGLPIRQWRVADSLIGPVADPNTALAPGEIAQEILPLLNPNSKIGWRELPMPKGSEQYAPHCQLLLKAARAGRKRQREVSGDDHNNSREKTEDKDEEDSQEKAGYMGKRWIALARAAEEPEREYLAKRRKGLPPLPDGAGYYGEGADGQGAPEVTEVRRRAPPPRRKPKKGPGRGRRKLIDTEGQGISASAEAMQGIVNTGAATPADTANASATEGEQKDTPMRDGDDDEDGDDDDGDDGDDDREEGELSDAEGKTKQQQKPSQKAEETKSATSNGVPAASAPVPTAGSTTIPTPSQDTQASAPETAPTAVNTDVQMGEAVVPAPADVNAGSGAEDITAAATNADQPEIANGADVEPALNPAPVEPQSSEQPSTENLPSASVPEVPTIVEPEVPAAPAEDPAPAESTSDPTTAPEQAIPIEALLDKPASPPPPPSAPPATEPHEASQNPSVSALLTQPEEQTSSSVLPNEPTAMELPSTEAPPATSIPEEQPTLPPASEIIGIANAGETTDSQSTSLPPPPPPAPLAAPEPQSLPSILNPPSTTITEPEAETSVPDTVPGPIVAATQPPEPSTTIAQSEAPVASIITDATTAPEQIEIESIQPAQPDESKPSQDNNSEEQPPTEAEANAS